MVLQEEHDARLLQLVREDRIPVTDLLHWLHAHHGPGPPSVAQVPAALKSCSDWPWCRDWTEKALF
jgi:hypothetical protein